MPLLHKLAAVLVVAAVVLGLTLPGDRHRSGPARTAARAGSDTAAAPPSAAAPSATPRAAVPPASRTPTPDPSAPIRAASAQAVAVKANELGEVPVIMYHRIMKKPQLSLDRSVAEFRTELTRLADEGYSPITAAEFVSGRIDVPAGRHPVVLTFDDSSPGHFGLDANGAPLPDTAVAIIEEVARAHPGFRPTATFYLNDDLFNMGDRAAEGLKWLTSHGFEIGNHTVTHADLSRLPEKGVRKEIGGMEDRIVSLTGAHTTTFAYPFGAVPRKRAWAQRDGSRYAFQGVFLAGWKPSESPFSTGFDRWAITRVRSEGKIKENDCKRFCSTAWLDYLDKHPGERYTSDGDPATVTFPAAAVEHLAPAFRSYARDY
ncbi:polysaccharide deacetylase family protein [Actinomadura atramentaria]|uniref:polysaccharide deacetylase family protein n=1 Tax=Actinomadura atramentaria TaxID=1990 RepID=UPI000374510F|nr:polysaccharide deacetylase family protein [Actinomadura atramentaria]